MGTQSYDYMTLYKKGNGFPTAKLQNLHNFICAKLNLRYLKCYALKILVHKIALSWLKQNHGRITEARILFQVKPILV